MLTTTELIERMTPTALAEVYVSIWHFADGNCDMDELETVNAIRKALVANVGEDEAVELLSRALL
jgi:hypothetical protein